MVSDLERTLLDALDRQDVSGGWLEVARGLWKARESIDRKRLVQYAKKYPNHSAARRLGFLLEHLKVRRDIVADLCKMNSKSKGYVLLNSLDKKQGRYSSRWGLQVNVRLQELWSLNR